MLFENFLYSRYSVSDFLCSGRAYLRAMPAIDAAFCNNISLVVFNPDSLYRTFPYAFVTVLTIFRFCVNWSLLHAINKTRGMVKYAFLTNVKKRLQFVYGFPYFNNFAENKKAT